MLFFHENGINQTFAVDANMNRSNIDAGIDAHLFTRHLMNMYAS